MLNNISFFNLLLDISVCSNIVIYKFFFILDVQILFELLAKGGTVQGIIKEKDLVQASDFTYFRDNPSFSSYKSLSLKKSIYEFVKSRIKDELFI